MREAPYLSQTVSPVGSYLAGMLIEEAARDQLCLIFSASGFDARKTPHMPMFLGFFVDRCEAHKYLSQKVSPTNSYLMRMLVDEAARDQLFFSPPQETHGKHPHMPMSLNLFSTVLRWPTEPKKHGKTIRN